MTRLAAALALVAALAGDARGESGAAPGPGAPAAGPDEPHLFEKPEEPGPTSERKFDSLGLRAGPWFVFFDGTARFPGTLAGGGAAKVSAGTDDFGVAPYVEAFLALRYLALYGDFWVARFDDESRTGATFTFGRATFSAAAPLRTTMDVVAASGRVQVSPLATGWAELGVSFGVRYVGVETTWSGRDPASGARVEASRRVEEPIPQVGVSFTLFVGRAAEVYVRARGFAFTWNDQRVEQVEGEVGVAWNLGDHFALGAEWQGFWLSLDDRRSDVSGLDRADVSLFAQGPMLYLRARF
jgi:hypothetical protein